MKRFASHFLFLPAYGYLKQYVVETEEGIVVRLFPLTEEIENVEWLPGAIVLLTQEELKKLDANFNSAHTFQELSKTSPEFYYNSGYVLVNFPRSFTKLRHPLLTGVETVARLFLQF